MVIGAREVERSPAAFMERPESAALTETSTSLTSIRPRLDLFGVLIDRVDRGSALDRIRGFLGTGKPHQIVTVNLDFIYRAEQDPAFRATINEADLAVPDGMPLIWLSHVMGAPLAGRVTGVELVDDCCRLANLAGVGVFFLGGTPSVAATAAARVRERHPGLVVTVHAPPFGPISPEEDERIVEMIQQARPGFLFVALGAPRQDLWIRAHRESLNIPVAMGVGCVLDLLAGTVRRAPAWMQSTGFEWSYRLMQEPGRLWRRYLVDDLPLFGRLSLMALDAHRTVKRRHNGHYSDGGERVTPQRVGMSSISLSDHDSWDRPGETASLLLIGGACLAWWAAGLILGPVWLAARKDEPELTDGTWPSGDGS
jgi:exopolysaccharide biosynthesis WecB/TagA/CpsF family protein